ncbi:MAG: hypothetical protein JXJ17_08495 [Anaerolineae bacterium]|nr:hypothetical protein [Anaerolineae bacterium]
MKLKSPIALILLIAGLGGCAAPASTIESSPTRGIDTPTVEITDTPRPAATSTDTSTPTQTPQPSSTPRPSTTPLPTSTPSPIGYPTETPAPTPTPYALPDDFPIIYPIGAAPEGAIVRIGIGEILEVELSPDEQWIAIGTMTGLYVLNTDTYEELWSISTERLVCSVNWSPDGSMIGYVQGNDSCLQNTGGVVADWQTGTTLREFADIQNLDWAPGSSLLAVTSHSGVIVWDTRTWEVYRLYEEKDSIRDSWWSPDGRYMALSTYEELKIVDTTTFEVIYSIESEISYLYALFTPDSQFMVVYVDGREVGGAHVGSYVNVYELSGQLLYGYKHPVEAETFDFEYEGEEWIITLARRVVISPDGSMYAIDRNYGYSLVDFATGDSLHFQTFRGSASISDFSPDGRYIVIGIANRDTNPVQRHMELWNVETLEMEAVLPLTGTVYEWFQDSQRFLLDYEGKLMQWHISEQEPRSVLEAVSAPYSSWSNYRYDDDNDEAVFWSPNSQQLAVRGYSDGRLTVWDANTGGLVNTLSDETALSGWTESQLHEIDEDTGYADENIQIHIQENDDLEIENLLTGKTFTASESWSLPPHFVYSQDGKCIALIYREWITPAVWDAYYAQRNVITVWDIETGTQLHRFVGHTVEAYSVAFSPDGTRLASVSADGSIVIWDVE